MDRQIMWSHCVSGISKKHMAIRFDGHMSVIDKQNALSILFALSC